MLLLLARSIEIVARKIHKINKNYRMLKQTHEVACNVHTHPTLSETIMEAAHGASGTPIHI